MSTTRVLAGVLSAAALASPAAAHGAAAAVDRAVAAGMLRVFDRGMGRHRLGEAADRL